MGFLDALVDGWSCEICGVATNDVRASESHFRGQHHVLLCRQKKPPKKALVQHVDGEYFEVKGHLTLEAERAHVQNVHEDLQIPPRSDEMSGNEEHSSSGFLHHWMECHAIICKRCTSRPILCKSSVLDHVRELHASEGDYKDLRALKQKLNIMEPLAHEPESIRLPNPWLGVQSFLQPPVAGYACLSSSCGWASESLETTQEHELKAHPEEIPSGGRVQVMIQFVTIQYVDFPERIYFPVSRFSDVAPEDPQQRAEMETAENSDFQKYLDSTRAKTYEPPQWEADAEEILVWDPDPGDAHATGKRKTTSLAESDQTHRSIAGPEYRDSYTINERYEILASLWNSPIAAELKPLPALNCDREPAAW